MFNGHDPRIAFNDWRTSDRPPLQAGVMLLLHPLFGRNWLGLRYQVLSTLLQCTWIPAVWALGRRAKLDDRRLAMVLAFLTVNGFLFVNSVFVWPKLLAAVLTVPAVMPLFPRFRGERPAVAEVVLAAGSAALGLLAHGGVFFTLVPLGLFLLHPRWFPGVKQTVLALALFAAMLAPWLAYQRCYDPPGNRLMKWHLAGVIDIDARSTGQTLVDAYSTLTPTEFLACKWQNLKALVPSWELLTSAFLRPHRWQEGDFFAVFAAAGILNLGWLMLAGPLARLRHLDPQTLQASRAMLGLALVSLAFWIVLMFIPGSSVMHQGSYTTMVVLLSSLAMLVVQLPGSCVLALWLIQSLIFAATWVFYRPPQSTLAAGVIGVGIATFACLMGLLTWFGRSGSQARTERPLAGMQLGSFAVRSLARRE
jgi:hypothetical protein